jgi:type IV secretory pathway TrbD component
MSGEMYVVPISGVSASVAERHRAGAEAALLGGTGRDMVKFVDGFLLPNSSQ